jgi:hypothetical protein
MLKIYWILCYPYTPCKATLVFSQQTSFADPDDFDRMRLLQTYRSDPILDLDSEPDLNKFSAKFLLDIFGGNTVLGKECP